MSFAVYRVAPLVASLVSLFVAPAFATDYPTHPVTTPGIVAADVAARDKAISDDVFEGRGPGTIAGEASAQWVADEMKRIGLKPGNNGSYFQAVPSVQITIDPPKSSLSIATPNGILTPKFADDIVYFTPHFATDEVKIENTPVVFVGYGVVAPEYHWNDYAGLDVHGKTVVILVNDPGNEDPTPDPHFFKGKAMTYYGRWTYKYEEAARQGAAAAIIVHETIPAAYGWQVVRNSNSGSKSWLDELDQNKSKVPVLGWMTLDLAHEVFQKAGLNYETLKAAANKRGFKAVPMPGLSLTATVRSTIAHLTTRNVIGVLPGAKHPTDYVLYTAHWDHLGVKPDLPGPDKIYNGAIDNGMGVASILEIAEAFTDAPKPDRSIAFICWTLEEQGLLGSDYFGHHPIWPLSHIVAGINIDANKPEGPAHDMIVVGNGASELEDQLAIELKKTNRVITADPEPEKGHFYRSDHISLAKVGVPMLDLDGGYDLIDGGTAAGLAVRDEYTRLHYHQPSDEYDPTWDLSGPIEDLKVFYNLGRSLANSNAWPNWYPGNEFRAIRDNSRHQTQ